MAKEGLTGQGTSGRSLQEVRKVAVWGSTWGERSRYRHMLVGLRRSHRAAVAGVGELSHTGVSPPKVQGRLQLRERLVECSTKHAGFSQRSKEKVRTARCSTEGSYTLASLSQV